MKVKFLSAKMKAISAAVAFALSIGFISPTAEAGLQSSIENIFNSMTNTSKPGVYEGVSRGVVTGGEFNMHNRIVSTNIIAVSPPSWRVGCGGIDFFGGAFSFANADQLIQLMRAIPANAAGYAFSLAIGYISEKIGDEIKDFLKHIQDWVKKLSNSCEMAKAVVDTAKNSEPWQSFLREMENSISSTGVVQDNVQAIQDNNSIQAANTPEGKKKLGNIVYRAIMEQDVAKWELEKTGTYSEDVFFVEEMMSLFGTVIVTVKDQNSGKPKTGQNAASDKDNSVYDVDYRKPILTIKDVFEGGPQNLYECTGVGAKGDFDTYCTEMSIGKDKVQLPKLKSKLLEILIGPGNELSNTEIKGVVGKYYKPDEGAMTATEKFLISNLPVEIRLALFNLSKREKESAANFVRQSISTITVEFLNGIISQFGSAVVSALSATKGNGEGAREAERQISESNRKLYEDAENLRRIYGYASNLIPLYESYLNTIPSSGRDSAATVIREANGVTIYPLNNIK